MKLASLKGGRDGRLVVVSNDLAWFAEAHHIAPTLQFALDHWEGVEPVLRGLAQSLEHGSVPRERFHEHAAASPLPRAYQWADGSAYVTHVELVRKARGAEMPPSFYTDPLMYCFPQPAARRPLTRRRAYWSPLRTRHVAVKRARATANGSKPQCLYQTTTNTRARSC